MENRVVDVLMVIAHYLELFSIISQKESEEKNMAEGYRSLSRAFLNYQSKEQSNGL